MASRKRDADSTASKASKIMPPTSSFGRKNPWGSFGVVLVITLATVYILTVTNDTLTGRTPGL